MSIVLALVEPESTIVLYSLVTVIVSGAVTVLVLIIKNWPKLLSSTVAVLHRDKDRRDDARAVYKLEIGRDDQEDDGPLQVERPRQPADPSPSRSWPWRPGRRRKRRR